MASGSSSTMERDRNRTGNGYQTYHGPAAADLEPVTDWFGVDNSTERPEVARARDGRILVRSSYNHGQVVAFTPGQADSLGRALQEDNRIRDLIERDRDRDR